jgi:heptosyltransferase-3
VLRSGALGDFILTLPVLRTLRGSFPAVQLGLVTHPRFGRLAVEAGLADAAISVDSADVARLFTAGAEFSAPWIERLRDFDTALSLLHDPDGVVAANLSRMGLKTVVARSPLPPAGIHAADHLLAALRALDVPVELPAWPKLSLSAEPESEPELAGRRLVLHPGSGSPRKNWPLERFVRLADEAERSLGLDPLFLLGEAEDRMAGLLAATASGRCVLAGLTLDRAARVLARAAAYVGNDSGISHLAAALGTPSVVLFGPTDPVQWAPRGDRVRVVRAPAPCSMHSLQPDEVLAGLCGVMASR